jgi:hypothetical protein
LELERRQAVSTARSRCETLWRQVHAEAAQARALGGTVTGILGPPRIAETSSSADARAVAGEFERHARAVSAECERARSAAVARSFVAHLPPRLAATIEISWQSNASGPYGSGAVARSAPALTGERVAAPDVADQMEEIAGRFFASLAQVMDEEQRSGWFAQASLLVNVRPPSNSTVRTLGALEREVGSYLREQSRRRQLRAEADQIALSIADVDAPAADAARSALADVEDRRSLQAASALARTALEQHLATLEREFVVEQTVHALRELGYEVDEGFRTTAVNGEFAVATNAALPHHGLQFKFPASPRRMLTNTVAVVEGTAAAQDISAEQVTCADLAVVESRVAQAGVTLLKYHDQAPGAVPVERRINRSRGGSARSGALIATARRRPVQPRLGER